MLEVNDDWNALPPSVAPSEDSPKITLAGDGANDGNGAVASQSTSITLTVSGYTAAGTGGALSYKWYKGATEIETDATGYTGMTTDKLTITKYDSSFAGEYKCEVYNTESSKGPTIGSVQTKTLTTTPIAQDPLNLPVQANTTATSVTLTAATGGSGTGAVTYAMNTNAGAPADGWQSGLTFTGLSPNTTYYFFAKKAADNDYTEATSSGLQVTTDRAALAGSVTVTGSTEFGETLTAELSTEQSSTGEVTYTWYYSDDVGGASKGTGSTYTIQVADIGKQMVVRATTDNYSGHVDSEATNEITKKTIGGSVTISGDTAGYGKTITAAVTDVTPSGAQSGLTYAWYLADAVGVDGTPIGAQNASTYTTQAGDVGKFLYAVVTGAGNYQGTVKSNVLEIGKDSISGIGNISGTTTFNEVLTAGAVTTNGNTATDDEIDYKWYRADDGSGTNKTEISGATGNTYTLAVADVGKYICVEVTAKGSSSSITGTATSAYVGAIAAKTQAGGFAIDTPPTVTYGTKVDMSSFATSGGEVSGSAVVTFTVDDGTGTAAIENGELNPTKAGNVTLTATKNIPGYTDATATVTVTIQKATPTLQFGNISQTLSSVTAVTVAANPAGAPADMDGITVEYQIPVTIPASGTCNCGRGNALAHQTDCAMISDGTHEAPCDCGADVSIATDHTKVHTSGCAHATVDGNACSCGVGNVAATHETTCNYIPASTADTWVSFADATTYLNGLTSATSIPVRAYIPIDTTNFNAIVADSAVTSILSVAAAPTPSGGGSATTTYTVTYKAGDHGAMSGAATEKVEKGAAPANAPTITAEEGWSFIGWSLDGKTVTDLSKLEVTGAITLTALYEEAVKTETAGFDKELATPYIVGIEENGTLLFKPTASMTRGEVAAILARTIQEKMEANRTYDVSRYGDMTGGEWYADYVGFLSDLGVIEGFTDGTFGGDKVISRAEFVTMVIRIDGVISGVNRFADVEDAYWAAEYIVAASEKGYVNGYEDGSFHPSAPIARAEAVKIMNAVLGWDWDSTGEMPFADVPEDYWAYDEIVKAATGK